MKKFILPFVLILSLGSSIRVQQQRESKPILVEEDSTPKIVLPELGINYEEEVTCLNHKRLTQDFDDDYAKLQLIVSKVPDLISMLKAIKTVLEIVIDQFSTSQSSFIQTNIQADLSKLEKDLFTYEDLEFLTFDQQTQRIIRDIRDALKLIKSNNQDNKPLIAACGRVISEIDFLIDYWTKVREYVQKELLEKTFTLRKHQLKYSDQICKSYIIEEGDIAFELDEPYESSGEIHTYKKLITFAKSHSGNLKMSFHLLDFVADKFDENKGIVVSLPDPHTSTTNLGSSYEIKITSQRGTLSSVRVKYYVMDNINSRTHMIGMHTNSNWTAYAYKPTAFKTTFSKRAFPIIRYVNFKTFTNKNKIEYEFKEQQHIFTFAIKIKDTLADIHDFVYSIY